jgi:hypothetical protein
MTNTQVSFAKQFVFDAQQFLTIDSKVAATRKTHRLATSCAIKRLGHWGAPVDHDWLTMLVGYSKPPDMETFNLAFGFAESIDASKHKCCVAQVEVRQT